MRIRLMVLLVVVAIDVGFAQTQRAVPRLADGHPDLSGVWSTVRTLEFPTPAMLPWAEALTKERMANSSTQPPPSERCLPSGVLRFTDPFKLVHTPTLLLVLPDDDVPAVRQVFLDGRAHPSYLQPTWTGHAIGSWDGETLIVERVGFNNELWIDRFGHPHTEMLKVIEKYRRPAFDRLEFESTIDDPKTYVRPWTVKRTATLATDIDVNEFIWDPRDCKK